MILNYVRADCVAAMFSQIFFTKNKILPDKENKVKKMNLRKSYKI